MTPYHQSAVVHCPTGLYDRNEGEIARLTAAINHSPTAPEKIHAAQDLRGCVAVLLACPDFDDGNPNCRVCREVATLRDKTASLIEKAGALAH